MSSTNLYIGLVNVLDGEIEEIHYHRDKLENFHHHFYFSPGAVPKIAEGKVVMFWNDEADNLYVGWRENVTHSELHFLKKRIRSQLRNKEESRKNSQHKTIWRRAGEFVRKYFLF